MGSSKSSVSLARISVIASKGMTSTSDTPRARASPRTPRQTIDPLCTTIAYGWKTTRSARAAPGRRARPEAQHAEIGDRAEELVDVLAAGAVRARRGRQPEEATFEALLAGDLRATLRAEGRLRDLLDVTEREIDLVEERRALQDVERTSGGEERVGLRATERDGATALARLDAPHVRAARGRLDRLEELEIARIAAAVELEEVAAHRALRDVEHARELLEREPTRLALEDLAEPVEAPVLREASLGPSDLRRARLRNPPGQRPHASASAQIFLVRAGTSFLNFSLYCSWHVRQDAFVAVMSCARAAFAPSFAMRRPVRVARGGHASRPCRARSRGR